MTPKEKSYELALEFRFRIDDYFQPEEWDLVDYHNIQLKKASIDCACFLVETILEDICDNVDEFEYWNEVYKQLEKL